MENEVEKMKSRRGVIFMLLGLLCITAAFSLTIKNEKEENEGARTASVAECILRQDIIPELSEEATEYSPQLRTVQTVEIDGLEYIGLLEIPSLELSLPVLNDWSEELLKKAPCRYEGSFLQDSMIIAGHNYRRHFSGIKQMKQGDLVTFTDVNGNHYEYETDSIELISGDDTEGMEKGEWDLTLFTCNYGGQKRVAVRCRRISG